MNGHQVSAVFMADSFCLAGKVELTVNIKCASVAKCLA